MTPNEPYITESELLESLNSRERAFRAVMKVGPEGVLLIAPRRDTMIDIFDDLANDNDMPILAKRVREIRGE